MKNALIKLIESITERIKPCKHKWVLDNIADINIVRTFRKYDYTVKTYRCEKCCEIKKFNTN